MHSYLDATKVALRVLAAVVETREPDPADVAELRRLSSRPKYIPADELAWDVLRQALKQRDAVARKGKVGGAE
jgi:hypothetical protein